jgi:hypothetical protein
MNPENRDRLRRAGEVLPEALAHPDDFHAIAEMCKEEFALKLFSQTAQKHRFLTGRERVTCAGQAMMKTTLIRDARFLDVFVEDRLALSNVGVVCSQASRPYDRESGPLLSEPSIVVPDPVDGDITVVEWEADHVHYNRFPHMVLLIREKEPRLYTIIPMDPIFLLHEDTAFDAAKIFSLYSEIDVCLVLGPEKCLYVRKDGTYKRSGQRPSGGAVAHRSVTGPHLYSLYLEPLQAAFLDRPDAFQWYDEFDSEPELFTGCNYSLVEPVISLSSDILAVVEDQVHRVMEEFMPLIGREWDGDQSALVNSAVAWVRALDIQDSVRIIGREDLPTMCSHPLLPSRYFSSPLYTVLNGVLDVMEVDLKRAGLLELVDVLLQPAYTASHIGYLRLLAQSERLAGAPDNETFWNRLQGLVLPAAVCSPVTLLRLEVWRRIEHLYRTFVPPVDTDRGSYAQTQRIQAALPLLMKVNERGPMWMWQTNTDVSVTPAVVVRLDQEGELHCEDGPAIIDPDGTKTFAVHGEVE